MDSYEIRWKRSAERDLRNIDPQQIPRIIRAIESLAGNPFPPQYRKLRGSEQNYRIRVGNYRVIYQVDTRTRIVTIYHVRHRREAYRR
ncbi:MAG: type II toxin-antitoxin system RelE/ParE family toxin [Candidatus Aenigmatarchaeota archaeon]|nr:MAG: type II toxin-antitoxin system RelE/ParE family toxin [Candidatus Aenigmarchaeota archaeon]